MNVFSSQYQGGLELREWFGDIDVYLFDALLKGRLRAPQKVLDAGCGTGRNLPYLWRSGFDVYAIDENADALEIVREQAHAISGATPTELDQRILEAHLEALPFSEAAFDAVLCIAVLHFAENRNHFESQLRELWRVLKPGGWLFVRLGTRIGLEEEVIPQGDRWIQPDGAHWYLPSAEELEAFERQLGAKRVDPLKSSVVVGKRSMGTWSLRKT